MSAEASEHQRAVRSASRAVLFVSLGLGACLAGAVYLWAQHGTAVFHEIIVAGFALCF